MRRAQTFMEIAVGLALLTILAGIFLPLMRHAEQEVRHQQKARPGVKYTIQVKSLISLDEDEAPLRYVQATTLEKEKEGINVLTLDGHRIFIPWDNIKTVEDLSPSAENSP